MDASPIAPQLFLLSIAAGACGLAFARRLGRSRGLWAGSWGFLVLAAGLELLEASVPGIALWATAAAALFPICLLAGSFAFAGRPQPRWLYAAALLYPLARLALAAWAPAGSLSELKLVVDPAAALASAWVLFRATPRTAGTLDRLLAPGMLALAGFLALDALRDFRDPARSVDWALWLGFGGGIAALQITAALSDAGSQQLSAEDALRRERDRLRTILASLGSSNVVLIDREGRIRPLLEEIPTRGLRYGMGHSSVPGREIREFLPGREGDEISQRVQKLLETGEPQEFEVRVSLPNGDFHFEVSLHPVRDDARIAFALAIVRDVTERRRAESESREYAQRLQRAQKLESLDVMAGGVAHDFNNLLVAILGSAELAEAELRDGGDVRPYLQDVRRAGERAAQLTNQLLAYTGRAQRRSEEIDLCALVRDFWRLLEASISKRTQLELCDDGSAPRVRADATQLRQVLMNLVFNASEALPDGAGVVQIRIGTAAPARNGEPQAGAAPGSAYLEVVDAGCGMDAATRERIFDPFYTTKFQGRGLGLATVQGIVTGHGGRIEVESEPGVGSRIRIELPAL